jgi:hypothetical protein
MKKFLAVLMMVISVVSFGKKVIISQGDDMYTATKHANPTVLVVLNKKTNKYTLLRNTASPHGGTFYLENGDEIQDSYFKLPIIGFDSKHPDGYDTGLKCIVYLKHAGRTYKEIDYNTLIRVLGDIGYEEYED